MAETLELEVVGMLYRLTTTTMEQMARAVPLHSRLEREPNNEHDENAVKVLVVEKPWHVGTSGFHVGYLPRAVASVVAPRLDAGEFPFTDAWLTEVDPLSGRGTILLRRKPRVPTAKKKIAGN